MKFSLATIFLTLAATGSASPQFQQCSGSQYTCTADGKGWLTCNAQGFFVYGGSCPPNTVCVYDKRNGSVYCVPPGYVVPKV